MANCGLSLFPHDSFQEVLFRLSRFEPVADYYIRLDVGLNVRYSLLSDSDKWPGSLKLVIKSGLRLGILARIKKCNRGHRSRFLPLAGVSTVPLYPMPSVSRGLNFLQTIGVSRIRGSQMRSRTPPMGVSGLETPIGLRLWKCVRNDCYRDCNRQQENETGIQAEIWSGFRPGAVRGFFR